MCLPRIEAAAAGNGLRLVSLATRRFARSKYANKIPRMVTYVLILSTFAREILGIFGVVKMLREHDGYTGPFSEFAKD